MKKRILCMGMIMAICIVGCQQKEQSGAVEISSNENASEEVSSEKILEKIKEINTPENLISQSKEIWMQEKVTDNQNGIISDMPFYFSSDKVIQYGTKDSVEHAFLNEQGEMEKITGENVYYTNEADRALLLDELGYCSRENVILENMEIGQKEIIVSVKIPVEDYCTGIFADNRESYLCNGVTEVQITYIVDKDTYFIKKRTDTENRTNLNQIITIEREYQYNRNS